VPAVALLVQAPPTVTRTCQRPSAPRHLVVALSATVARPPAASSGADFGAHALIRPIRMPDGAKALTAHPQVRAFILCLNIERARRDSNP